MLVLCDRQVVAAGVLSLLISCLKLFSFGMIVICFEFEFVLIMGLILLIYLVFGYVG